MTCIGSWRLVASSRPLDQLQKYGISPLYALFDSAPVTCRSVIALEKGDFWHIGGVMAPWLP